MDRQGLNYEELYERLLERGGALHRSNQKRIRVGLILLAVFTVAMILIRLITDSDRVVFMVIWVIGMFAISIYLISIEYIDSSVQKTLEEVTERETGFEELLPDSEAVRGMLHERLQERHDEIQSHYVEHWKIRFGDEDEAADDDEDAAAEADARSGNEAPAAGEEDAE